MTRQVFTSSSVDQTNQLAQSIASKLSVGDVLALTGDLGSGKTTFTQALAKSLGITKRVTSPTFIISRSYQIPNSNTYLHHFDLYRLGQNIDSESIGLNELLTDSDSYIVIEWPKPILHLLPQHTRHLSFNVQDNQRTITLSSL